MQRNSVALTFADELQINVTSNPRRTDRPASLVNQRVVYREVARAEPQGMRVVSRTLGLPRGSTLAPAITTDDSGVELNPPRDRAVVEAP
jgi:hypothetical protein